MRGVFLALAVLVLAADAAQAQMPVTDKIIVRTGKLKLDIHYPETGRPDLDRIFADYAKSYAADGDLNETSEGANSGTMSYKIRRNDAAMFSVQVSTNSYYAGHAHGMPDMVSFNFLMPDGAQVFLPELVDGKRGLDRISELAIADLTRQLGTGDLQSIRTGASPNPSSFQNFVWLSDELELTFIPDQVAAYAAGTRMVHIPLSALAEVIRSDPRAPAASFDCRVARSRIEKAVCSDAELARLDRQAADKYAHDNHREVLPVLPNETPMQKQHREAAQGYHDRAVAWQRDWLARRDKDCASASVACLKASYRAHLTEPGP